MAQIKKLFNSNNSVLTNSGTEFFPVTVANAVYYNSTTTLHSLLTANYNENNTDIYKNGIYSWLKNLTDKSKTFLTSSEFQQYKQTITTTTENVDTLNGNFDTLQNNYNNLSINITKIIKELEEKTNLKYDKEPTNGSTNLVNSGDLFSYINDIVKNGLTNPDEFANVNYPKIKSAEEMEMYPAYEGEIVLYIGETTEKYKYGYLYRYHDGITKSQIDSMLCNC